MHPWSSLPVHNMNTGLGYATIQEAINAPETLNGHTIFVEAGTYYEHIVVNKTLALIGENNNETIIDGSGELIVVQVVASNVKISGFTIRNGGGYVYPICSGLYILHSNNTIISENIISNNGAWGIYVEYSNSTLIENNVMAFNCQGSNVESIYIEHSHKNWIIGNEIKKNTGTGVGLRQSFDTIISGNNITNNVGGISLFESHNNVLADNYVAWTLGGVITLSYSFNNIISNNAIFESPVETWWTYAIELDESSSNTITANNISQCQNGIRIEHSSSNNVISSNRIDNCKYWDGGAIYISASSNNRVYHNDFVDNKKQVQSYSSSNVWDDGYPSGGNYWSNYVGVDVKSGAGQDLPGSDGIGDTPYIIDENNRDRYPLMYAYGAPPPPTYALTITTTVGGTTNPTPGTYSYSANSMVQVTAIPNANYLFDHWELDGTNVGSANPYSVYMDKDHTLKAVFSLIPPPLSVSISPLSASILVGQSVTFTSTVSGGYTPYSYQWHLNGAPVSGANQSSWTFTPTASGIYYVYLKVTDAKGNTAQSDTARITIAALPVGGYSIPIQVPTKAEPVLPYIALIAALTAIFTKLRPKTKRKHRQ